MRVLKTNLSFQSQFFCRCWLVHLCGPWYRCPLCWPPCHQIQTKLSEHHPFQQLLETCIFYPLLSACFWHQVVQGGSGNSIWKFACFQLMELVSETHSHDKIFRHGNMPPSETWWETGGTHSHDKILSHSNMSPLRDLMGNRGRTHSYDKILSRGNMPPSEIWWETGGGHIPMIRF